MARRMLRMGSAVAALTLAAAGAGLAAQSTPRPDLADMAQGQYEGSVISDARGSGRSDVLITVTKTARNTVTVTSDYPRLPTFTTHLSRYMQTIQKDGPGGQVFLLDLSKSPYKLDVTDDDASWSGERSGDAPAASGGSATTPTPDATPTTPTQ